MRAVNTGIFRKLSRAACLMAAVAGLLAAGGVSQANELIGAGETPPPFSLPSTTGRQHSLEDLAGKVGALVFWSTWSPRSAEILEDFRHYHEEFADQGLVVLAVNVDGEDPTQAERAAIGEYVEARALPFPVLLDDSLEVFSAYGVVAHPSTLVIDRQGRVAYALGGYPLSLREELKTSLLKALGVYVEPPPEERPAVGHVPRNGALPYYNLGVSLMEKGQRDRALEAFRKAADRDPDFFEPALMAARLSLASGDMRAAETLASGVDADSVNRGDLVFLVGSLELARGRDEAAERVFRSLPEGGTAGGWAEWGVAMVLLEREEHGAALEKMHSAAAVQPENLEAEALLRRRMVEAWRRGEGYPLEEGFISLFPVLAELRDRYRRMFGTGGTD